VKTIGLTGGVGMGKSTCARFLADMGVPVIDTDELARELVRPGQPALEEIRETFGPRVFNAAAELDRTALAEIVFADENSRRQLEDILHPRIQQSWQAQVASLAAAGTLLAVVVIPLLYETAAEYRFDVVACVACSETEQGHRLAARGWTVEQSRARQAAQLPIVEKIRRADFVIWSEGGLESHRKQVMKLLAGLGLEPGGGTSSRS
jgi:dephospho-CoA kinase